ncbi:MAG: porin, partial [candidate division Zixibacteria bacterium]|nr:porin [candidate division Zixibacteria bacterium]
METTLANISKDGTISNPSVKHGNISLSGIVHEHFVSGQDETSTFESRRARLAVKGDINDYAQIKIQTEFAKSPKLLDGKVTISPNSNWSISIGQYEPPFGTDFLISATSTPFVNDAMATGLGTDRDIGGTISFREKINPDFSYKLTAGMFNGSGINTSDVNDSKNFVARLEAKLMGTFTFAPNIYAGKTNEINSLKEDLLDIGSSLSWSWRQEKIAFEYIRSKHGDTKRSGWHIWGGHMFSIDSKFMPKLQVLARYEQQDLDMDINNNRTDRITLGTNIFVDNKYTKIQLNYQINTEEGASISNNEFLVNFQLAF